MKIIFLLILLLSSQIYSQTDNKVSFEDRIYDPFFSGIITDNEGNSFNISNLKFIDEFGDDNYFFWVRRNSGLYALSFKNIAKIEISEDDLSDIRYKRFTRATLTLVTGERYDIYIKTTGLLQGIHDEFGSKVSFYLHYNLIRSIEFSNKGEYWLCPFCETIYFDNSQTCIYDKTPLIKGVLSPSDK